MQRRLLLLSIGLVGSAFLLWYLLLRENWVENVMVFNDLVLSGLLVGMFIAAGGIAVRAFEKPKLQVEIGIPPPEAKELPRLDFLSQTSGVFQTDPLPKNLRIGDVLVFRVRFKGVLDHACLQAEAKLKGKIIKSFPDYETISRTPNWFTRGKLTGFYDRTFEWKSTIPTTFRPGEYSFLIRAYQREPYPLLVSIELHALLWLKRHLIRSIDSNVLYYSEWYHVHQDQHDVVISP